MQVPASARWIHLNSLAARAAGLWDWARAHRLGQLAFTKRAAMSAVELILVAACAHQVALLFWTFAAPGQVMNDGSNVASSVRPFQVVPTVRLTSEDIFRPAGAGLSDRPQLADSAAPATSLNLQLFGLRAPSSAAGGSAIIRRPDGTQDVFSTGENIMDGVTLERIRSDHVVIRRMGILESLYLDVSRAPVQPTAQSMETVTDQIPRRRLSATAAELFKALQVSPGQGPSGAFGLIVRPGTDPSLFSEAGFEPGDILVAVNGQPTPDLIALPAVAKNLEQASRFNITIDRQGQSVNFQLLIDR